jgi:hypothetical protein
MIKIYLKKERIFSRVKKVEKDHVVFVVDQVYLVLLEWMHYHVHVKSYLILKICVVHVVKNHKENNVRLIEINASEQWN